MKNFLLYLLYLLLSLSLSAADADGNLMKNGDCESASGWNIFGKNKRCELSLIDNGIDGKAMQIKTPNDYAGVWKSIEKINSKGEFLFSAYIKMVLMPPESRRFSLVLRGTLPDGKKVKLLSPKYNVDLALMNKWIKISMVVNIPQVIENLNIRLVSPPESVIQLDNISFVKVLPEQVKKIKKTQFEVLIKPKAIGSLKITELGKDLQLDTLCLWKNMFGEYGKGDITLRQAPEELIAYPFMKINSPYKTFVFSLNEPARTYWLCYTLLKAPIPIKWKMNRQYGAVLDKLNSFRKFKHQTVYYMDLPAGKYKIHSRPNRVVNLAVKPFSAMNVEDCVLNVKPLTKSKVYPPGKAVKLQILADNPSKKDYDAKINWSIKSQNISGEKNLKLTASKEQKFTITLPALKEGFYQLYAKMSINDKLIDQREFPVAVIPEDKKYKSSGPLFPFGFYNKYFVTEDPVIMEIYYRWICNLLLNNNMNTLIGPALDSIDMETNVAKEYGIKLVMRTKLRRKPYASDAIIAYMYGDEPKIGQIPRYQKAYQKYKSMKTGKPLLSCMIAGGIGVNNERDPMNLWKLLNPELRICRLYVYRKNNYGLVNWSKEKYKLSPVEIFRKVESATSAPWWFVMPALAKPPKPGKEPYWRNATGNELKALCHLVLANGARGIIGWALQSHGNHLICTIKQRSLEPEDDKLEGLKEIGILLKKHSALLLRHKRAKFTVKSNTKYVNAEPRVDPKTGKKYIYVVNIEPNKAMSATITASINAKSAKDVYSGKSFRMSGKKLQLKLAPAQGMFLELQ
ncbi:MAG: hypothetical protein L3J71_13475 [Victivallaceae bacterium]|nr:hypothetical protein [Victivallaceae bacterium]